MVKKFGVQIIALALVLLMTGTDLMAQTATRVRFARGSNSATVKGRITGSGGVRHYVLRAQAGQTLTATLSSGNNKVDFTQGAVHDTQFSRTVDQNGDVNVDIDNHGGATNYTLTISIQ